MLHLSNNSTTTFVKHFNSINLHISLKIQTS